MPAKDGEGQKVQLIMNYPLAELIDRWTILDLHDERGEATYELRAEKNRFWNSIMRWMVSNEFLVIQKLDRPVQGWMDSLRRLNAQIWDLESDIRRGKEGELGLEEVGRRALKIRDINRQRIALKNEISKVTGDFIEHKTDHASA